MYANHMPVCVPVKFEAINYATDTITAGFTLVNSNYYTSGSLFMNLTVIKHCE